MGLCPVARTAFSPDELPPTPISGVPRSHRLETCKPGAAIGDWRPEDEGWWFYARKGAEAPS